jgi:hypothetical protein
LAQHLLLPLSHRFGTINMSRNVTTIKTIRRAPTSAPDALNGVFGSNSPLHPRESFNHFAPFGGLRIRHTAFQRNSFGRS